MAYSVDAIAIKEVGNEQAKPIQVDATQIPLQVKKVIVDQTGNVLPMNIPDEEINEFVDRINAAPWTGKEVSPAVPTMGTHTR